MVDRRRRALPLRGANLKWSKAYDRDRLDGLRERFAAGTKRLKLEREARRRIRQAIDLLAESQTYDALVVPQLREAEQLVCVSDATGLTADMYWLSTAHLRYTTAELADLLEIDEQQVPKRISAMHAHFRRRLGRDEPCMCGHAFGNSPVG